MYGSPVLAKYKDLKIQEKRHLTIILFILVLRFNS